MIYILKYTLGKLFIYKNGSFLDTHTLCEPQTKMIFDNYELKACS